MPNDRVHSFSNGSQCVDWMDSNCNRCTKGYDEDRQDYRCDLQKAIDEAGLIGDGTVTPDIARRMGINEETKGRYVWPCAEADWTEEWKAEWRYRQTRRYKVARAVQRFRYRVRRTVADRWQRFRQWVLWPIAEWRGMRDPDGCWAAWCAWAMGHHEWPGANSGETCKVNPGDECRSCWCGKFVGPEVAEELAKRQAIDAN